MNASPWMFGAPWLWSAPQKFWGSRTPPVGECTSTCSIDVVVVSTSDTNVTRTSITSTLTVRAEPQLQPSRTRKFVSPKSSRTHVCELQALRLDELPTVRVLDAFVESDPVPTSLDHVVPPSQEVSTLT